MDDTTVSDEQLINLLSHLLLLTPSYCSGGSEERMNELAQKLLKPDARITVAVYGHVSHQQAQTIGLQQYDAEKETKVNPGRMAVL